MNLRPASETSRENPGKSHFLHPAESSSSKKLKETTPRQWSPVERKETRRYSPVVTRELFSPSEYKKRDHSQEFRWNSPSPGYVPAVSPEMGKGLERFSTAGREQSQVEFFYLIVIIIIYLKMFMQTGPNLMLRGSIHKRDTYRSSGYL